MLDGFKETIDTLLTEGVLGLRNGSAELFFDDIGLLQEIVLKKKKRKEPGKELEILHTSRTRVAIDYDGQGTRQQIEYTTKWRRTPPTQKASH